MTDDYTVPSDILIEFLEVAVHSILYTRQLYPESIFKRMKKYQVPINVSIHPQLNSYINECLKAAQFLAKQNELRKFIICIFSPDKAPIERFIFDVIRLNSSNESDPFYIVGEQALRAFLLRIASLGGVLKPLPVGSTYTIQLLTDEASAINLADTPELQNFPWIEVDASVGEVISPEVVPIRTIDTDYLVLQLYVEESAE